jgi:surface antigen
MNEVSDETLVAFADGRLDETQRSRVQRDLGDSAALRERLAAFSSTKADSDLWRVFDQPMREPVPQYLVDLVMASSAGAAVGQAAQAVRPQSTSIVDRIRDFLLPQSAAWAPAFAYSAAVAVGLSLGWMLHAANGKDVTIAVADAGQYTGLLADGSLRSILETAPSGPVGGKASGQLAARRVIPTLTFRSRDGAYCRQYEMTQPGQTATFAGMACRTAAGQWVVQTHVASSGTAAAIDGKFQPASGQPGSSLVEATVTRLIEGDAFGVDEERQLIAKGWRSGVK